MLILAAAGGILSSMPVREGALIVPEPVPEAERLHPSWVELEYRYWWPDEAYWEEETHPVAFLSAEYGDAMRGWDGELLAPVPLTWEQALLVPGAAVGELEGARWILVLLEDCAFTYYFDGEGRTARVEMDPVADSGSYTFTYGYEARPDSPEGAEPEWIDRER